MEKKEKSNGSKTNLNESALPLLEEGEKEVKDGKTEETAFSDEKSADENDKKGSDKKKDKKSKKEKKAKEPKEKKEGGGGTGKSPMVCAENFTVGLNVHDRDEKHLNDFVNLSFEDVLSEPDSSQGFEFFWRVTFLLFTSIRGWIYRILAALLALPMAVLWALVFAILNVLSVWFVTPVLRIYDILLFILHRVWSGAVRSVLDPFAKSAGLIFNNIKHRNESSPVASQEA